LINIEIELRRKLNMARVSLQKVTKCFGKVRAVEDFSLEIEDGEFLTLLGPSGCGKTTLLRCVAGLETPTSGEIRIDDKNVTQVPPRDRDISMVFQSYALFPHMSVRDNIAFPLKMRKASKEQIQERVKETADLLEISSLLDRRPKELSGGQMQRVALGRALVRRPKVFLMDEPLSNLDAKLRIYMRAELKALQERLAITTIYVTHDQVEAMTMSRRVAVLNQGFLQQIGTPHDIYDRPSTTFVAGFMGNPPMNFLTCNPVEKNGKLFLKSAHFMIDATAFKDAIGSFQKDTEVTFGVRPEDLKINRQQPPQDSIEAKIYVMEPLGSGILVTLMSGEDSIKAMEIADFDAKEGDTVWLTVNKKKMHVFDKNTGKLLA
jgi:multiple sugar transport system ATP-binding protein